jgi:large subunit ribosomal protein L1
MVQTKADLIKEAKTRGITLDPKAKIGEIKEALRTDNTAQQPTQEKIKNEEKTILTAKAGKRSAKAQAEAAAKEKKEMRKIAGQETPAKVSPVIKTRSRRERRGKHYRESADFIEMNKRYGLAEAVSLAKKTSYVKFDATVELHVNLSVDPRHADQNVRDSVVLPAGTGKKVRVAVLCDDPALAKTAGADLFDVDTLLAAIDKGMTDFDILIATSAFMPRLGKYARILGPRGLMPNPKSGTVTSDIDKAVREAKAGRVEYRVDTTGIIHVGIGKVSFSDEQLIENIQTVLASIQANKPSAVKSNYIAAVHLATSMGPSVAVDLTI